MLMLCVTIPKDLTIVLVNLDMLEMAKTATNYQVDIKIVIYRLGHPKSGAPVAQLG